eukprot:UN06947
MSKAAWGQGNMRMAYEQRGGKEKKSRSLKVQHRAIEDASASSSRQMQQIQHVYKSTTNYDESDEEDEAYETMLDNIENDIATESIANKEVAVTDDSIQSVLNQMKTEPKDETMVKQKYKLFEDFLKNVETSRKATYDFWGDCKEDFSEIPTAAKQVEEDLKNLDSEDSMGINFEERVWFVYSMTVQADKNNEKIKQMLKRISTKLDML